MKKLLILSVLILLACQPQEQSMTLSDQAMAAVKEASQQYGQAIVAADADKLATLADQDIILMPPGSPAVEGYDAVMEFFKQFPEITGTIEPAEVDGGGNLANVRGNYSLTFQVNDTTQISEDGKYLEVWRRQEDGSWKVYWDIWNSNSAQGMDSPEEAMEE